MRPNCCNATGSESPITIKYDVVIPRHFMAIAKSISKLNFGTAIPATPWKDDGTGIYSVTSIKAKV